jgi:hypothetical protein
MKKNRAALLVLCLFTSAGCAILMSSATPGQTSGCVVCHTDGDRIKQMYKPPKRDFKPDEGVG